MKFSNKSLLRNFSYILVVLVINIRYLNAQVPSWQWAQGIGGIGTEKGLVTSVASGTPAPGVYVAGTFSSPTLSVNTLMFGAQTFTNAGGKDIFVFKYNSVGQLLSAFTFGGTGDDIVTSITSNITTTQFLICGYFNSPTLTTIPSSSPTTVYNVNPGTNDIFIAQCGDLANNIGLFTLASFGGNGDDRANGIRGIYGNAIIAGSFTSPNFTIGTTSTKTITNSNISGSTSDIFAAQIMNFSPTTSTVGFVSSTGAPSSNDYVSGLAIQSNNTAHIIGSYSSSTNTTIIGTSTLTSIGGTDLFLTSVANNGVWGWSKNIGGTTSGDVASAIELDGNSQLYIVGSFNSSFLSLQSNTTTASLSNHSSTGTSDAFIAKYNTNQTLQWCDRIGGNSDDYGYGIALDKDYSLGPGWSPYVCGVFSGTTMVAAPSSTLINSNPGITSDLFIVKYNYAGTALWGLSAKGNSSEVAYGITADPVGNVYTTGFFDLSPTTFGTNTLTSLGTTDIFTAKISCASVSVNSSPSSSVCPGGSATLTATGATSYTWQPGNLTTTSVVSSPTATTIYTVNFTNGVCISNITSTLSLLSNSLNLGPNMNLSCKQRQLVNATCIPTPTSVSWSPTVGLSSPSVLTPTAIGTGSTIQYTVTANLSNGCAAPTKTLNINAVPISTPALCFVTVDSLGVNNEIYWDKTVYPGADSFFVYREVSSSVYKKIASLPRTALSMYVDTNRSVGPANGNPNLTAYKYKLQYRDSCGAYSPLSLWHQTIFIQDQLNGNFNWNQYTIEPATLPVSLYTLKRRNLATGTETIVLNTTSTAGTDPSYNSFWPTNTKWFVDYIGFSCNVTAKIPNGTLVLKSKTKSNQSNDKQFATGINKSEVINSINVYPNPTKDVLYIDLNNLPKAETSIELQNALGQVVYQTKSSNQNVTVNTSEIACGIYLLNIKQNNKTVALKKVIVNK